MTITPSQSRAARGLIRMDQATLAEASRVSRNTIVSFEKGQRVPGANNLVAIRAVLEADGIEFTNGGGVQFKAGLDEPAVEIDTYNGIRRVMYRIPGQGVKICSSSEALSEAEKAEKAGSAEIAMLLRVMAAKLRGPATAPPSLA
jgi:transcriptional regulator with XRE-family HTH domain